MSASSAATVGSCAGSIASTCAVGLHGAAQILEVLAPQLADAEAQRHHLAPATAPARSAARARPAGRTSARSAIQAIERLGGVVVLGIEIDDRAVGLDGALGIAELAVVDLAEHEQHLLLLGGRRRQLRLLGVDVLEIAPAPEPDVEPLELIERRAIGVVDGEHVLENADRALEILQHLFVELRRPVVERLLLVGGARRSPPCAAAARPGSRSRRCAGRAARARWPPRDRAAPTSSAAHVGGGRLRRRRRDRLSHEARDLVIERVLPLGIGDAADQRPVARRPDLQLVERAGQPLDRASASRRSADPRPARGRARRRRAPDRRGRPRSRSAICWQQRDLLLRIDGVARLDLVDADEAAASRRAIL